MRIVFTLLLFLSSFFVLAQYSNNSQKKYDGLISGTVIDNQTRKAVEYANVVLLKMPDTTILSGTVTDASGVFRINKVPNGRYLIKVQFVGYKTNFKGGITVGETQKKVDVGIIYLDEKSDNIAEVTVSARQSLVESRLDKKIVRVDPMLLTTGGSAIDVLKNVPSVSVDAEGGISLRGSDNVTILIDGRPSNYSSLDQVPASIIDHIEVVTNPSAKYDASGMAGIVNIITKKKIIEGFNGQIIGNVGNSGRYNANLVLNYGKGKVNTYVIIDYRHMKGLIDGLEHKEYIDYLKNKETQTQRKGYFGSAKFGCDYRLNEKNTLSFVIMERNGHFSLTQTVKNFIDKTDTAYSTSNNQYSDNDFGGLQTSLTYVKTTSRKDEELKFLIEGNAALPTKNQSNQPLNNVMLSNLNKTIYDSHWYEECSYVRPIAKIGKIECGFGFNKSEFKYNMLQKLDSIYNDEFINQSKIETSSKLNVQNIISYVQYSGNSKKVHYQVGVRFENETGRFTETDAGTINRNFMFFYPSASISYDKNDTTTFIANYSNRVNYPDLKLLNTNIIKNDLNNWTQGNANLEPEFFNSFELGMSNNYKKVSFTNTIFFRQTTHTYTRRLTMMIDSVIPEGMDGREKQVTSVFNGKPTYSFGIEHFHSYVINKLFRYSLNLSFFASQITDSILFEHFRNPFVGGLGKCNVSVTPFKSLEANVSAQYNSRNVSMQGGSGRSFSVGSSSGRIGESWQVDYSMKKTLLGGNASISMRISDIFNTAKFSLDAYTNEYYLYEYRKRNSRILTIGFMYKINGGVKQKKRNTEIQETDF